jgi:hypothetical protein
MVKHKLKVKHYYQDPHNPTIQEIIVDIDYPTAYALFAALLESHLDFEIEMTGECTL